MNLINNICKLLITTIIFLNILPLKPLNANLSLAPIYLEITNNQQSRNTGVLTVGNTSDQPIRISLSTTFFNYDYNGVFQRLNTGEYDLTNYLIYTPREITIPPHNFQRIRLQTTLPSNLPEGEYRVAIFAETLQTNANQNSNYQVNLTTRIGSAIYVRNGNLSPNINISTVNFNPENQQLRLLVNNTGNATAIANIKWQLSQNGNVTITGKGGGSYLPNSETNSLLKPDQNVNLTGENYQLTGEMIYQENDREITLPFNFNINF